MYDMNLEFYKELTMYIIAGKKGIGAGQKDEISRIAGKGIYIQRSDECPDL